MSDYIFGGQTPNGQDFDGGWHTLGVLASPSVNCNLIGGRAQWPTTRPANFLWLLFKVSDMSIVAQVDLAALSGTSVSAWNTFTSADFTAPGDKALVSTEQYIPAVATNGDFVFNNAFSWASPIGAGIVTASAGRFHNGGSGAVFPDGSTSGDAYFADMLVQASGGPVAGTGRGNAAAGTSATAAKRLVATGRMIAVGGLTAITKKRLTATAASPVIAVTSASSSRRNPATAMATAIAAVRDASGKRTAAMGRAVGVALGLHEPPAPQSEPGRLVASTVSPTGTASSPSSVLTAFNAP